MIIDGLIENSNLDIIDNNINNITWWTDKHNRFAIREMIEFFSQKERVKENNHFKLSKKTKTMKNIKFKIYYRFPMFLRALVFFIYKYFLRLGFLGGWQGFIWCFLQSFWYRILVDIKILEINNIMKKNNFTFKEAVKKEYGVEI